MRLLLISVSLLLISCAHTTDMSKTEAINITHLSRELMK